SAQRALAVRSAVTLRVRRAGGRRYVLSGVVRPASATTVRLYSKSRSGRTELVARGKVNRRTGRWGVTHALPAPATVLAQVPRTRSNEAGTSPSRKIR